MVLSIVERGVEGLTRFARVGVHGIGVNGEDIEIEASAAARRTEQAMQIPREAVADVHHRAGAPGRFDQVEAWPRLEMAPTETASAHGAREVDPLAGTRAVATRRSLLTVELAGGAHRDDESAGSAGEVARDRARAVLDGCRPRTYEQALRVTLRAWPPRSG